ncbi:hypothetical protein GM658_16310 [Pseudoduganella eburnea]|uniref:Uncharacterized protein n=1 Tax=Massilia eburnea TaxID=1776165 RepID=A0A6L6QIT6_9BURK|nr:hypothetical protein [Massilia eburnea]MTW12169.1 hypothetical protein [Massilia eburnea]
MDVTRDATGQSAARAGAAVGSSIFSVFGAGWLIAWSQKTMGNAPVFWAAIALVALAFLLVAFKQFKRNQEAHAAAASTPESKRAAKLFNWVNVGQGIAIFVALNVANNLGHPEWFIPAFIFVVGLHFIPLAPVLKAPRHYVVGVALMLLAATYPFLAKGGPADPVGCLGTGLILWASAISGLLPERGAQR